MLFSQIKKWSFCIKMFFSQIRSHAQKYFLKVQKNGTGEHLPPPRPKRKTAHPYHQKAYKNGLCCPRAQLIGMTFLVDKWWPSLIYLSPAVSQAVLSQQLPQREQGSVMSMDTSSAVRDANANSAMPSWDNTPVQPFSASHVHGHLLAPSSEEEDLTNFLVMLSSSASSTAHPHVVVEVDQEPCASKNEKRNQLLVPQPIPW